MIERTIAFPLHPKNFKPEKWFGSMFRPDQSVSGPLKQGKPEILK